MSEMSGFLWGGLGLILTLIYSVFFEICYTLVLGGRGLVQIW